MAAIEGRIVKYRFDKKLKDAEQNLNSIFQVNKYNNYFTNPPLINKVLLTENDLYIGLMNGYVLSLNPKNLRKKKMRQVHTLSIYDLYYSFNYVEKLLFAMIIF